MVRTSYQRVDEPAPSPPPRVEYHLELVALDEEFATFASALNAARVVLPVDSWVFLDRPGHLAWLAAARP